MDDQTVLLLNEVVKNAEMVHGQGADSRPVFHQVNRDIAVIRPYISNFASFGDKGSNGFKSF